MNGIIEIIFEGVPDENVDNLVRAIIGRADVLDVSHSELGVIENSLTRHGLICSLKKYDVPVSIFINLSFAEIGGVVIAAPLLRVLRFENVNEASVVFSDRDVKDGDDQDAVSKLAEGTDEIAHMAGALDCYCGFEPATDMSTRLFTRGKVGPLFSVR